MHGLHALDGRCHRDGDGGGGGCGGEAMAVLRRGEIYGCDYVSLI